MSEVAQPRPPEQPTGFRAWHRWLIIGAVLAAVMAWLWTPMPGERAPELSYTRFHELVEQKKVERVTIRGDRINGVLLDPTTIEGREVERFVTRVPPQGDEGLVARMRDADVTIDVEEPEQGSALWTLVLGMLPWVLIIGVWIWMSRRARQVMGGAGNPLARFTGSKARRFDPEHAVPVKFSDVAGLETAKRDLREVVDFLRDPKRFESLGVRVPRGVLLVGPPGTGKTLLARAVAGEAGVAFFSASGSDFIELFVGVGASRVRELFAECKREKPAILFIDEIDAVGRARGTGLGGGHDEREQTLNQLLHEMDGFEQNEHIVVLAATNRPDVLDAALLRPGRFDRQVMIDKPALEARQAILKVHTREKPLAEDVDLEAIARATPGFAGADLANLVNEAAMQAARRDGTKIRRADFDEALDKVMLGDRRELTLGEEERRRVAIHEAGHTVVASFTEPGKIPRRVSIMPRGLALGSTQQRPEADRYLVASPELEAKLAILMGGHAAEELILGNVSTGAEDDLRKATGIAQRMVTSYGMSDEIGPVFHEVHQEHPFLGRRVASDGGVSDATTHLVESETRRILVQARERAKALLERHRDRLERLVEALLEHETLEDDRLEEALGVRVPPRGARESQAQLLHARVIGES